jgi:hypothetical protein
MNKVKWLLLLAVHLLITTASYGQESEGGSLFTGRHSVSIPIHVLKGKNISIPISLDYSSDGVKVEEHPSWTGMGWRLNAGGAITRTVHKMPDEYSIVNNVYSSPNNWKSELIMKRTDWATYGLELTGKTIAEKEEYYNYASNKFDEPDDFVFSFLGNYGHFYFDENGNIKVQSDANIKVIYDSYDSFFTLIDDQGNRFEFRQNETTLRNNSSNPIFLNKNWLLTKVLSADGFDSFTFCYEAGPFTAQVIKNETASSVKLSGDSNLLWGNSASFEQPCYLTSINYNGMEEVTFVKSKSEEYCYPTKMYRECLVDRYKIDTTFLGIATAPYWSSNSKPTSYYDRIVWLKLDRITVKRHSKVIKNYDFAYNNIPTERLFLNSISIKDGVETLLGKYGFLYNCKDSVPKYLEVVGDHWGYNNGVKYGDYANDLVTRRVPNEAYLKKGVLSTVTYPTGRRDEYEYEINDYSKFVNEQYRDTTVNMAGKAS